MRRPTRILAVLLVAAVGTGRATAQGDAPSYTVGPDQVRERLQAIDVNTVEPAAGFTLLHACMIQCTTDAVRIVMDAGASVNARSHEGRTPLYFAAQGGRTDVVTMLLQAGAAADAADTSGRTPLISASLGGHTEVARVLLAHGANVTAATHEGGTALVAAIVKGNVELVKVLLDAGADPEHPANMIGAALATAPKPSVQAMLQMLGRSIAGRQTVALLRAAQEGDLAGVRAAVRAGADVSARAPDTKSNALELASAAGHVDIVRFLVGPEATGTRLRASGYSKEDMRSARAEAAAHGQSQVLILLLHVSPRPSPEDLRSLLQDALQRGGTASGPTAELLLRAGASAKEPGALTLAASAGSASATRALLAAGADARHDSTALFEALKAQHFDVARLLIAAGAPVRFRIDRLSPLQALHGEQGAAFVAELVKAGADVNDTLGGTSVLRATIESDAAVATALVNAGADVTHDSLLLHDAMSRDVMKPAYVPLARAMIEHGAAVNATDRWGGTPLLSAAYHPEMRPLIPLLLAAGARVKDTEARGGRSVMYWVAADGDTTSMKILLAAGGDPNEPVDGTPLLQMLAKELTERPRPEPDPRRRAMEILQAAGAH